MHGRKDVGPLPPGVGGSVSAGYGARAGAGGPRAETSFMAPQRE